MYDLRDPTYRPQGVSDPGAPMRNVGPSDVDSAGTEASAVLRLLVDYAEWAAMKGLRGVPRSHLTSGAQKRAPFSRAGWMGSPRFTLDAMVNNHFLVEYQEKNTLGRPTRYVTLPDGTLACPTDEVPGAYPFLQTELYGTFSVPYEKGLRIQSLKVLCIARGTQLNRSFKCHRYPDGRLEVWRES